MKLPVIFVCENNYYATHMPVRDCRVTNNIHKIADPFCIDKAEVDGNDVLKVYEAGRKAVGKCRNGEGPFFLECLTYRLRGHVGPDDNVQGQHTDIRPPEEVENWRQKDPIMNYEKKLVGQYRFDVDALNKIKMDVAAEVKNAHVSAKNSPYPDRKNVLRYVFK
jgi:pyruvate dehydrogenase E1 component alpha subunit